MNQEERMGGKLRRLGPQLQRSVRLAQGKGSSMGLTALLMAENGFRLHNSEMLYA